MIFGRKGQGMTMQQIVMLILAIFVLLVAIYMSGTIKHAGQLFLSIFD